MSSEGIAGTLFDRFERYLRWVYPGLLFTVLLPLALKPGGSYWDVFRDVPWGWTAALVIASGFLTYLVERYLIHEPYLASVLFCRKVGAAVNFSGPDKPEKFKSYQEANAELLWRRFGQRPQDGTESGERAETRFDNYMASRMASIHALGATCLVGIVILLLGQLVPQHTAVKDLPWWGIAVYVAALSWLAWRWAWHAEIAARAEQHHYTNPQAGTQGSSSQ